ncbi:hypothetical protein FQN60_017186 [Etheostoma spectabile]|uniref:Ig-like domain-containing protein n=1 Tax=Etheostoma spectabile TaxID=54343 RepID=A0A5J5DER7_9PERO|nr:hypothetical protein FQN60_017186 [Etheostoma spectabile]
MFVISNTLNDKNLMSIITVNQPQDWDRSTLLCRSSNSLGSASQQFCVNSYKPQTSAQSQDRVMLPVFITTVVALLLLVCSLLCVIRSQKTHHNLQKSQCTGDTSTVNVSQLLTSGEGNEVPNTTEEDIYVNTNALRQTDVPTPATIFEPTSAKLPSSGLNNAQGDSKSLKTQNEEGNDVIYSRVNWKPKNKKNKGEDYVDTHQPGRSYLEEERCMVGDIGRGFVDNALYMGSLYDNVKPRNVEKESEYAQKLRGQKGAYRMVYSNEPTFFMGTAHLLRLLHLFTALQRHFSRREAGASLYPKQLLQWRRAVWWCHVRHNLILGSPGTSTITIIILWCMTGVIQLQ